MKLSPKPGKSQKFDGGVMFGNSIEMPELIGMVV